jgi:hypothetical protein
MQARWVKLRIDITLIEQAEELILVFSESIVLANASIYNGSMINKAFV